jgi:hypothetical protein
MIGLKNLSPASPSWSLGTGRAGSGHPSAGGRCAVEPVHARCEPRLRRSGALGILCGTMSALAIEGVTLRPVGPEVLAVRSGEVDRLCAYVLDRLTASQGAAVC